MGAAEKIEDDIRTTMQTKRVRVTEFFKDFDRLRSGFITESQFQRGLDQFLNLRLTSPQVNNLIEKYGLRKDRTDLVNYRLFSEAIDRNFAPNEMTLNPEFQTLKPSEYLGTERTRLEFGPQVMERVSSILKKIENYYTYNAINVRTSYEDFDKHHNGLVTMSQFERSFPGPPDVEVDDIKLLAEYYKDPIKPNLTNYLNFHNDIEQLKRRSAATRVMVASKAPEVDPSTLLDALMPPDPDVRAILDKMRIAVHKNGIRIEEFFKDHDKLRSGVITRNQFLSGLALGCGKEGHLTNMEMDKLADYYQSADSRILYKPVCDIMKHAFNVPNLIKQPTVHPVVPANGSLSRSLNPLSEKDEEMFQKAMHYLSEIVRKRRLLLYPFFKDFDRGVAYTRNVTKKQFGRILRFLSLEVSEEDLRVICLKFEEPISGDVNYPAFCQAVDQEFNHYTVDAPAPVPSRVYIPPPPPPVIDTSQVNFDELMARIRHHVLVNRLRVIEFFEDFDSLRSGSITSAIFKRCLNLMGVTWVDKAQIQALIEAYADPKQSDCVLWHNFMIDVESVFTQPDLEKDPTRKVPPSEAFVLPKVGTLAAWNRAPDVVKSSLEEVMTRMRSKATQRRVLAKPVFQDFDRHNNGHVTKHQFRQSLATLNLCADDVEMEAIESRYSDSVGFDYIRFLADLMPEYREGPKYKEHIEELKAINSHKKPPEFNAVDTLEQVMTKIKAIVIKKRMRIYEFMKDYDKLKTGRVLESNFARALDLAGLGLKESEVHMLIDAYRSLTHPGYIEYLAFSNEVESIFTLKYLEKNPLITPEQFQPPVDWQLNTLSEPDKVLLDETLMRLATHIRKTRVQLFPLFEDYDRVHNGYVTKLQFHRVLTELNMGSLLNDEEVRVIFARFRVQVGGRQDFNYIPFCNSVYSVANFDPTMP